MLTTGTQTFVHCEEPSPDAINPIENWEYHDMDCIDETIYAKPYGGFWTCPLDAEPSWDEWALGDFVSEDDNVYHLTPSDSVNVLHIKGFSQYQRLLEKYGRENVDYLDYEMVFEEYDGIHLYDPEFIECWDVESIVWDDWHFTDVERVK